MGDPPWLEHISAANSLDNKKCGLDWRPIVYVEIYVGGAAMKRGGGRGGGAVADRNSDAPWRPTEVQREYRALLDRAKDEPQVIVDSDDSVLIVELKARADFEQTLVGHLANAAQFQAAFSVHRDDHPAQWAAFTPYPWLGSLDREQIDEFAKELIAYALDAAQRRTIENLEGNLRAWQSTAEIYEDPDLLALLTASIDSSEIAEVFPPSDEEVRAAEGVAAD